MEYKSALEWFGTQTALARALGVRQPTAFYYSKSGIPPLRQLQIERITKGALRADDSIFDVPHQGAKT